MDDIVAQFLSREWIFECACADWYEVQEDWEHSIAHIKRALDINVVLNEEALRRINSRILGALS